MKIDRKRMLVLAAILLGVNAVCGLALMLTRPPITHDGWAFLDSQRGKQMAFVADGMIVVLARRPIGGWESISVRLFLLANLPASFVSALAFRLLQDSAVGSSRSNSDLVTLLFVAISAAQWLGVSALLSMRR